MNKKEVRVAYYKGIRQAALKEFKATEESIRKLTDVEAGKIEKLVADIDKRHIKLLKRLDRQIKEEQ